MPKIALCGALFSFISLSAQDIVAIQQKLVAEAQVLSAQMVNGPMVKSAPYSAEAVNESVNLLADGNRIVNTNSATIYRDGQGRTRREEYSGVVFISDPVQGVNYTLHPQNKTALKNFQPKRVSNEPPKTADGKVDLAAVLKTEVATIHMTSTSEGFGSNTGTSVSIIKDSKDENLGTQMIEGISAEGTRRTTTIPAGQIGNELPIVIAFERWYSPELQVTVMSTRSDPRTGTTTYKLTKIIRGEPAPTLFQLPPDYTLSDLTSGARDHSSKPKDEQ
jgi:hypothetical protein